MGAYINFLALLSVYFPAMNDSEATAVPHHKRLQESILLALVAATAVVANMPAPLLAAGANSALANADGQTAHGPALRKGHVAIVKLLSPTAAARTG